jgi:hypothetical protein
MKKRPKRAQGFGGLSPKRTKKIQIQADVDRAEKRHAPDKPRFGNLMAADHHGKIHPKAAAQKAGQKQLALRHAAAVTAGTPFIQRAKQKAVGVGGQKIKHKPIRHGGPPFEKNPLRYYTKPTQNRKALGCRPADLDFWQTGVAKRDKLAYNRAEGESHATQTLD